VAIVKFATPHGTAHSLPEPSAEGQTAIPALVKLLEGLPLASRQEL
jgi:hypothetical protein